MTKCFFFHIRTLQATLNRHKIEARHTKRDDSKFSKAPPREKSKTLRFLNDCRFSESSSSEDESLDESDDDEGVACKAQVCEAEKTIGKGKVY